MKTQALRQALDKYGFDAAFGGARRDEEKSRAKERMFSFRSAQHRWDPKTTAAGAVAPLQRPKRKGESIRVFPLSNWTELDVWQYIYASRFRSCRCTSPKSVLSSSVMARGSWWMTSGCRCELAKQLS